MAQTRLRVPGAWLWVELGQIVAPDQNREDLIRIRLVQVDEYGSALASTCVMSACNHTTNGCVVSDVIPGLIGGQRVGRRRC